MRSIFTSGIIICASLFLHINAIAQENTKHQLTNLKNKELKMDTSKMLEKNKETIRSLYEDILNTRKLQDLHRIVSPDYTGIRGEKGPDGLAEAVGPVIAACPDIQWTIEDLIAEGDKVVVRWSWKGTNTGSFRGFPASGKLINDHAIAIYQLKDAKIVAAWMQSDRLGFLQQIGVVPQDLLAPQPHTNAK